MNAQPAGPTRSPADSLIAYAATDKVRGFVTDLSTGAPVPGVIVCLEAVLSEGAVLPLGVLSSDHAGYFAFALPRHLPPGVAHLRVYPYRDAAQKLNCTATAGIGAALLLRVSPALATDVPGGVGLASIQRPDARDWALSPLSFATRASLTVGEDGCETLVPDSQAERELRFQRVVRMSADAFATPGGIVRPGGIVGISADASPSPGGYGPINAVDARYRLEAYSECAGVKPPSAGQPENAPIRFGWALEFRQRWSPVGHSLGQVVYSLPLAPCESVDIAVIEWSRQDTAVRRETDTVTEQLLHQEKRDRMIDESVNAALSEQQGGWNLLGGMSTAGSASASATIPIYGIPVNLAGTGSMVNAIGGGIAQSWGDRSLTGDSMQDLHDLVTQATSVQRSLNSTVIVQSTQAESNVLQTRTVTNHNHCHALTVQYYEVLRNFRVITEFVRRRDVVLIPYAVFTFDWRTALRFESILRPVLVDDSYADCFDAVVRQHCCPGIYDAPPAQSPPTAPPPAQPQPNGPFDVVKDPVTNLTINAGDTVQITATGQVDFSPSLAGQAGKQDADGRGDPAPSGGRWPAPGLSRYSLIYKIGNQDWQQGGTNVFVPQSHPAGLLTLWVNDDDPSDNKPAKEDPGFKVTVWVTPAPGGSGGGAGTTGAAAGAALAGYTKTGDECCEHRLLGHLNSNLGFYNRAIWLLQDPLERRLLLDAALASYPKLRDGLQDRPVAVDGNYVAYVWNDPDAIWRPFATYPVGAQVTFAGLAYMCVERHQARPGLEPPGSPQLWQLEDEIPEALETIMSLPTRGVFAEAQLGHCNACEVRDVSRFWQWEQSPCEQPPQISGITPGPKGQPETPQPTPLPAPVVQIAQTPAEPDPVGLAAALKLLGTPNIFRDMSGLSETSKLLDALASGAVSLAQARQMASQAKQELAKAASGSGTPPGAGGATRPQSAPDLYDKLQVVKAARDQGLLTEAGAQSATQRYLHSDTGSGSADIIQTSTGTDWAFWTDLITFAVPADIMTALAARGLTVVPLARAMGDINLDYYPVRISKLPTVNGIQLTPEALLKHVRLHFDDFVDKNNSAFPPLDATIDKPKWESDNPRGAVINIQVNVGNLFDLPPRGPLIDQALVVCSDSDERQWKFSTLRGAPASGHPVTGNRMWAIDPSGDDWIFYTMGADRATAVTDWAASLVGVLWDGADQLWLSLQNKVADFVNTHGGQATVRLRHSDRYPWETIQRVLGQWSPIET